MAYSSFIVYLKFRSSWGAPETSLIQLKKLNHDDKSARGSGVHVGDARGHVALRQLLLTANYSKLTKLWERTEQDKFVVAVLTEAPRKLLRQECSSPAHSP